MCYVVCVSASLCRYLRLVSHRIFIVVCAHFVIALVSHTHRLVTQQRVYAIELDAIQKRGKTDMADLKASFPMERKYEQLLHQILPESIASSLAAGKELIAVKHNHVTIIFIDLVDFTAASNSMSPEELVAFLNLIFGLLDELCDEVGLTKIKTIGDSYMCAANIPERIANSVQCAADFALGAISLFKTNPNLTKTSIRVGMAFGDVIAGVIGTKKPSYDVWGNIVNLASRMEHNSKAGFILVTHELSLILGKAYILEERPLIDVKGCGLMQTYYLTGKARGGQNVQYLDDVNSSSNNGSFSSLNSLTVAPSSSPIVTSLRVSQSGGPDRE